MSVDDFRRMTPSEFDAVFAAYRDQHTALYRDGWIQTRFLAHAALVPHMGGKRLTPQDIVRFDWEVNTDDRKQNGERPSPEEMEGIVARLTGGNNNNKETLHE